VARAEAKAKGAGVALGLGAAFVALFGLGFLLATIAVALAIVLDTWLALLLVTLGLFAVTAVLGLAARGAFRSGGEAERGKLGRERQELQTAVADLKRGVGEATNISKLRAKLPAVAAGALGAGFFVAGGIGATMRFLARKGRER
jgi:Putative Actinobacterial Holin-X, holin superfamily III